RRRAGRRVGGRDPRCPGPCNRCRRSRQGGRRCAQPRIARLTAIGFALALVTAGLTMAANLMLRADIDAAGGFALDGVLGIASALLKLSLQPLFAIGL